MKNAEATVGNLIDHQKAAFISSIDEHGYPNTKAMLPPRKREGIKVFYFTTNTSSMRARQYQDNPKACIYFCDQRFSEASCFSAPWKCWRTASIRK